MEHFDSPIVLGFLLILIVSLGIGIQGSIDKSEKRSKLEDTIVEELAEKHSLNDVALVTHERVRNRSGIYTAQNQHHYSVFVYHGNNKSEYLVVVKDEKVIDMREIKE